MGVLNSSGWIWWIERGKLALGTTSNGGETVTAPTSSTAGKTIRVYCKEFAKVYSPGSGDDAAEFSSGSSIALNEYSKLPAQFHEALIAKVMEKLYRKDIEGVQASEYWRKVYKDFVIGAKKYANTNRLDSGFTVNQYDM